MRTFLREMNPSDLPAVEERLREQNERDHTNYSVPQIFDERGYRLRNIPLALVAVDEETGKVVQGHVWEVTLEQMSFGISARATVCSMQDQEAIFFLLRSRGFRDMHIFVPKDRAADMEHGLERIYGMSATGMVHFYRMLNAEENDKVREFYETRKEPA